MSTLGELLVAITADAAQFFQTTGKVKAEVANLDKTPVGDPLKPVGDSAESSRAKFAGAAAGIGLAMTGIGIGAGVMVDSVNAEFVNFDKSLAGIKSIGATADEIDTVKESAIGLSKELPVSAQAVVDSAYLIKSAGFKDLDLTTPLESGKTALELLAETAVAGGEDITSVTQSIITALGSGFGVEEAVTALANGVKLGKYEMGEFGTEMQKNIATGAGLGMSIGEIAAANVLLQNSFSSAEESGTGLKTMLSALVDPKKVADLEEMGVKVKDSSGNFVGLQSVLEQLKPALEGAGGNVEQQGKLFEIFGSYGVRAAQGRLENVDALGEYETEMGDAGAVTDMMNAQLESTASKMEIAENKTKAAKIALGEAMAPATELAAELKGNLAGALEGLPDPLQKLAGGALVAAEGLTGLGPAVMGLGGLAAAVPSISGVTGALSGAGGLMGAVTGVGGSLATLATGPVGIAILAIAAIGAGILLLDQKFHFIEPTLKWFGEVFEGIGAFLGETFGPIIDGESGILDDLFSSAGAGAPVIEGLRGWVQDVGAVVMELGGAFADVLGPAIQQLASDIGKDLGPIIEDAFETLSEFGSWLYDTLAPAFEWVSDAVGGFFAGFSPDKQSPVKGFIALLGVAWKAVDALMTIMRGDVIGAGKKFAEFQDALTDLGKQTEEAAEEVDTNLKKIPESAGTELGKAATVSKEKLQQMALEAGKNAAKIKANLTKQYEAHVKDVDEQMELARQGLDNSLGLTAKNADTRGKEIKDNLKKQYEANVKNADATFADARSKIDAQLYATKTDVVVPRGKEITTSMNSTWADVAKDTKAGWSTVTTETGAGLDTTKGKVDEKKPGIVNAASLIWDAIRLATPLGWGMIVGEVAAGLDTTKGKVDEKKPGIVNAAGLIWDAIASAVPAGWGAVTTAVDGAAQGLVNTVGGTLGGLVGKARDIWDDIVRIFSQTITIAPPVTQPGTGGDGGTGRTGDAPVASFTFSSSLGRAPLRVSFDSTSTGSITSYEWYFGDGATGSGASTSHTYNEAATYNVALKVTGPGGSDTEQKIGCIVVLPAGGGTRSISPASTNTAPPSIVRQSPVPSALLQQASMTTTTGSPSTRSPPASVSRVQQTTINLTAPTPLTKREIELQQRRIDRAQAMRYGGAV
jgi:TP901 family phage tail tape measure protein